MLKFNLKNSLDSNFSDFDNINFYLFHGITIISAKTITNMNENKKKYYRKLPIKTVPS